MGRMIEIAGWVLGIAGLMAAGVLVFADGPVAHQITILFPILAQENGQRLLVTLTALVCTLPGIALARIGARMAGPDAVSTRWIAALTARRAMTGGRWLAVSVCLLIAALAITAILSLLPDMRAAGLIP